VIKRFIPSKPLPMIKSTSQISNHQIHHKLVESIPTKRPRFLDTLAQLAPPSVSGSYEAQKQGETLKKRARSKAISRAKALRLVDVNSELKQAYWNTFHCSSVLLQEGKKITAKYCKNRWCDVCNRIRTANLIKGYLVPISELKDKQLVTLTIPNIPAGELPISLSAMSDALSVIRKAFTRRGYPIIGLRKMECTYNPDENNFHPHFHFVIEGIDNANRIVDEWLMQFPEAKRVAQDIRPADNNSVMELFKYFAKTMAKSKKTGQSEFYPEAMDVIFRATKGRRVFQPMGIAKLDVSEDIEELQSQEHEELEAVEMAAWNWNDDALDWVNYTTGECLTQWKPPDKVLGLLEHLMTVSN